MVFPDSSRISRVRLYSGYFYRSNLPSSTGLLPSVVVLSRLLWLIELSRYRSPTTPIPKGTGLGCSRFARHYSGNRVCFLFPGYWDVSVHPVIFSHQKCEIPIHNYRWVSPFGHPRVNACLAAHRGLSQLATSFIEISSRGIHFTLFCNLYNNTNDL